MSVINKMLQDLDARGSAGGEAMQPNIRPVLQQDRGLPVAAIGAAAALVLALGAGGGWWWLKQRPAPAPAPAPLVATVTNAPRIVAAPAQPTPPEVTDTPAPPAPAPVEPEEAPQAQVTAPSKPSPEVAEAGVAPAVVPGVAVAVKTRTAPKRSPSPVAPPKVQSKPIRTSAAAATADRPRPVAVLKAEGVQAGRHMSPQQRGEADYRRALASLAEGRVQDAIAFLEQALATDPRHDSARQTLVGLLVESGRADDAVRVLGSSLALDPRQPAMAMLLARLQIERGASGIDTLTRTLPYAAGNAEYHAFLAGALGRAARHREAIEQYQAALRVAPDNGVWWMGLGISLQAEKRNAEAVTAFERARELPSLTPQLRAFVDRRLQLLSQ